MGGTRGARLQPGRKGRVKTAEREDPGHRQRAAAPRSLYPQLRARKNASAEQVAAHQRERLRGAMVEAVARYGYAETSVQELTALAGVSKKTLYHRYDDKLGCLLATIDDAIDAGTRQVSTAYRDGLRGGGDWRAGMQRTFEAFAAGLASNPKAARLVLVEAFSVGDAAAERIERCEAAVAKLLAKSLAEAGVRLPNTLVTGVVHGLGYVACNRVIEAEPGALRGRGEDLLNWLLSYDSPRVGELDGGLSAKAPPLTARKRNASSQADPRRRMLQAAARIAADGGYSALTGAQIAEQAGVERDVFSDEFDSTEQCFLAALELLNAQALGRALRDSDQAESYPVAVCWAIERLLQEVASDPVFARVGFAEIVAAGRAGVGRRATLIHSFANVLVRCAPRSQRPSSLIAEAVTGAIWGIARDYVVSGRRRELPGMAPYACYLALAPIVGAEQALDVIAAERLRGSGVRLFAASA